MEDYEGRLLYLSDDEEKDEDVIVISASDIIIIDDSPVTVEDESETSGNEEAQTTGNQATETSNQQEADSSGYQEPDTSGYQEPDTSGSQGAEAFPQNQDIQTSNHVVTQSDGGNGNHKTQVNDGIRTQANGGRGTQATGYCGVPFAAKDIGANRENLLRTGSKCLPIPPPNSKGN